jgi:hypothetical protein
MTSTTTNVWHDLFSKWPASIPKRGVLVTTLNEATPFKSFMVKGEMLLLERTNPDSMGARFIMLAYDAIHMIKLTDPLKEELFAAAGFSGHFAKT